MELAVSLISLANPQEKAKLTSRKEKKGRRKGENMKRKNKTAMDGIEIWKTMSKKGAPIAECLRQE